MKLIYIKSSIFFIALKQFLGTRNSETFILNIFVDECSEYFAMRGNASRPKRKAYKAYL